MKAKTASSETAVLAAERKLHNTWVYIKRHWQLYLLFLLPAVALTLVFKYAPMGGVLIAFQKYNPFKGIWGSEWVGFKNFTRFMSSPDFQRYLINTLKLSVYGLLWGFPIPILLAFLLNRIESKKIKQKVQLVLYMPNFISVIVLCGIVRVLLSVTGPVNGLLHTSINFMTLPEAFRKPGAPLGQKDPFSLGGQFGEAGMQPAVLHPVEKGVLPFGCAGGQHRGHRVRRHFAALQDGAGGHVVKHDPVHQHQRGVPMDALQVEHPEADEAAGGGQGEKQPPLDGPVDDGSGKRRHLLVVMQQRAVQIGNI